MSKPAATKPPKSRPRDRSPLYRLIAAGQLVHRALLEPALSRGLAPGDDALLYLLAARPLSETDLMSETGLDAARLGPHLGQLVALGHVERRAIGAHLLPHYALTKKGKRLAQELEGHWDEIERALLGDLKPRQRRIFGRRLLRLASLLGA
ncbi:MAG: MarR family winged helix-turn-helix transcriptional regulator [Devosia sp.]